MKNLSLSIALLLASFACANATLSMWEDAVNADGAIVADTSGYVIDGTTPANFNYGAIGTSGTYHFISNATDNGPSVAFGNTGTTGLKLEQWQDTGRVGFSEFGVVDGLFDPVAADSDVSPFDVNSMITFVLEPTGSTLYIDGVLAGTTATTAPPLTGDGLLGGAQIGANIVDVMDGTFLGVATFDGALTGEQIESHYEAYTTPIPEPAHYGLAFGGLILLFVARRRCARN